MPDLAHVGHSAHLAWRFFGSLWPFPPGVRRETWARAHLLEPERTVWDQMSPADRRHSVGVARRTIALLGEQTPRAVVAAALLHDSGKTYSGLGTFARVAATLVTGARGAATVRSWDGAGGWRGRVATYRRHPELGARRLEHLGSDPVTVAWTREHHLPAREWTVDRRTADALKTADGD